MYSYHQLIQPPPPNKNPSIDLSFWINLYSTNATEKSFFQYWASKYGFAIVFPDTSPRGAKIEGEDDSWDFGTGAGFYVDATQSPWNKNYQMYSYIHKNY